MKKLTLFTAGILFSAGLSAQNLVLNPSLEDYTACPSSYHQIANAQNWNTPQSPASSEYMNACATNPVVGVPVSEQGYQYAHTGNGMCGFFLWTPLTGAPYREYVTCKLSTPLTAGECYCLTMYVNLANISNYTTDAIGVHFANTAPMGWGTSPATAFTPQIENTTGNYFDTLSWTPVTGTYHALGGEEYLVLGNFKTDAATTLVNVNATSISGDRVYILLDDVSLVHCPGEPSCMLSTQEVNGKKTEVFPNPFSNELYIENAPALSQIIVYDVYGKQVLQQNLNGSGKVFTQDLPAGIYMYEIKGAGGMVVSGKLFKQ